MARFPRVGGHGPPTLEISLDISISIKKNGTQSLNMMGVFEPLTISIKLATLVTHKILKKY
jgi:hypothetical protein